MCVESAYDVADIPIMLAMFAVADANRFVRHQNDDQYSPLSTSDTSNR